MNNNNLIDGFVLFIKNERKFSDHTIRSYKFDLIEFNDSNFVEENDFLSNFITTEDISSDYLTPGRKRMLANKTNDIDWELLKIIIKEENEEGFSNKWDELEVQYII